MGDIGSKLTNPKVKHQYLGYQKNVILFITLLSVIVNVLFLVLPMFSMQVFDRVLSSENRQTLVLLTAITVFLVLSQNLLDWIRMQIMLRYGYQLEQKISALALKVSFNKSIQSHSLNSEALSHLNVVKNTITAPSVFAIFDAPFTPLFLVVMYLMHPLLGHFALGGVVLLSLISLFSMAMTKRLQTRSNQNIQSFNTLTNDWLKNAETVQALGMTDSLVKKWASEKVNPVVDRACADTMSRHIMSIAKASRLLLQVGVLGISVILVLENEVTAGVLIAASMIMARVLSPVEQAINHWQAWVDGWSSHKYLLNLHLELPEHDVTLPPVKGEIEFNNVTLGASDAQKPILESVSFHIPAGTSVGILGNSGAGKSTLAKAIVGLETPTVGEIRIDGATHEQRDPSLFGSQIGYVSQDTQLLSGTVAQNICRFEDIVDSKGIIEAAKLAGVHETILSLPRGYQTLVGSLGIKLSGGQQQKISLARALYTKPSLLVLDEPETNLDHQGQLQLREFIQYANQKAITVVLISHSMMMLQHTKQCLVLGQGTLTKFGSTKDILNLPQNVTTSLGSAS